MTYATRQVLGEDMFILDVSPEGQVAGKGTIVGATRPFAMHLTGMNYRTLYTPIRGSARTPKEVLLGMRGYEGLDQHGGSHAFRRRSEVVRAECI
jgi:hypothetical protein